MLQTSSKQNKQMLTASGQSHLLSNWCRELSVTWSPASTKTTWVLLTS